eukprot:TRINITY_DN31902_c0_g1_i3.p1 TRINITY_DN31902_c0_g1~~TRINITY_DN31902_c0_g1_i3.p1  ORF type:complete len:131 (-),score=9.42 TRINITY_DN31902_c0_g1_i3:236-628(-)
MQQNIMVFNFLVINGFFRFNLFLQSERHTRTAPKFMYQNIMVFNVLVINGFSGCFRCKQYPMQEAFCVYRMCFVEVRRIFLVFCWWIFWVSLLYRKRNRAVHEDAKLSIAAKLSLGVPHSTNAGCAIFLC